MGNLKNRGKEGRDDLLFGTPKMQEKLKEAVTDMCYLLSRGYAQKSSVQLQEINTDLMHDSNKLCKV